LSPSYLDDRYSDGGVLGRYVPEHSSLARTAQILVYEYLYSGKCTPTLNVEDEVGKRCKSTDSVSIL